LEHPIPFAIASPALTLGDVIIRAMINILFAITAILNIFDTSHEYESRPAFAEACWYEDQSSYWIEIATPYSAVCDMTGYVWVYVPILDNGD
jgi:hypothetical protein